MSNKTKPCKSKEVELFPMPQKGQVKNPERIQVIHVYHHHKKKLTADQKMMIFAAAGLGVFCITLAVIFLAQVA